MAGNDSSKHASQVDWSGVLNKPVIPGAGPSDIGQLSAAGFVAGQIPKWSGSKFVPAPYPTSGGGGGGGSGTQINNGDLPAIAVRRYRPGFPGGVSVDIWMRQSYDVKLFGAMGDGVSDDSAAINLAITLMNIFGGGRLHFPQGQYLCNSPLLQITSPCLVEGDGFSASSVNFGNVSGFSVAGGNDFCLHDLSIRLSSGTGHAALSISAGTGRFSIESAAFYGSWSQNLSLDGLASGGYVRGSQFSGSIQYAVWLNNISWLSLSGCTFFGGAHGIFAAGTTTIGNTFSNLAFTGLSSTLVNLSAGVSGCRIQNISFGSCSAPVPFVYGTGNYLNELFGLGGNADTDFDSRRELYGYVNWGPGAIPSFGAGTRSLSLPGGRLGDQISIGPPYALAPLIIPFGQVTANDTALLTLANLSPSLINLGTGVWKVRAFN